MKKLLLLLALSFFSIQSFAAGCPDGSEPVKSISADGTYFVFECGNKATEGNSELGQISNTENEELQVFFEHDFKCMNQTFDKFVNVFGVMVAGSSEATLEKVIHTAGVLAQYLDNDEDGIPDDSKISSYLEKNKFIVPVWREKEREKFVKNRNGTPCQNIRMSASMYVEYDQWAIGGIQKTGTWDTNLEEVWHVVSQGWYEVYPEYFGNNINNSLILTAMNKARGGIFNTPPLKYPQNAWYTYDDETCGYFCQKSEYFYWILMANINALDPYLTDKCYYSKDEWHICNKSELKEKDVLAYELLNNYNFVLPTKIPDGKYMSKEQPERESNIFDSIDENDKIVFKAENEQYIVHVFTDADCPSCAKFHSNMQRMNALGITVKYLAYPLEGIHPGVQSKMEKIWCAEDKAIAMHNYKTNRNLPNSPDCVNPVAEQLAIGKKLEIWGTPTIFFEDVPLEAGYWYPEELLEELSTGLPLSLAASQSEEYPTVSIEESYEDILLNSARIDAKQKISGFTFTQANYHKMVKKDGVLVKSAPETEITGWYQFIPKENDWHTGIIFFEKGQLKWKNEAGVEWNLQPDINNNKLITGEDNPYQTKYEPDFMLIKSSEKSKSVSQSEEYPTVDYNTNLLELCKRDVEGLWTNKIKEDSFLFVVASKNGNCEYGLGNTKYNAFENCTKNQEDNNIVGICELYGEAGEVVWDGHLKPENSNSSSSKKLPDNSKFSRNRYGFKCNSGFKREGNNMCTKDLAIAQKIAEAIKTSEKSKSVSQSEEYPTVDYNTKLDEVCRGLINNSWNGYLDINKNEFNSKGYMFVVAGEDGRCESGIGRTKENALNECTKWQEENNIVGVCEFYAEGEEVVWDGSVWDDSVKASKSSTNESVDYVERLKQVKALLDSGIINQDDFEKMKQKIIDTMN